MKVGSTQFATTTGDAEANNEEEALDEVMELEFLAVEEHIFFSKMATRNINARTEMVLFAVVWIIIIIIIDIVLVVKLEYDGSIESRKRERESDREGFLDCYNGKVMFVCVGSEYYVV
mmetsp:Transcript_10980/g.12546  ORF Transcript_10980/g.12546 Transcript_10980/m.12546 type:complete len:118 (+) Transcript_10980:215-568(+)